MKTHGHPAIICLTPVKNEAWILDRFLQCASLWADYIIIADQGSTDSSREIALRYPKVVLIDNASEDFSEVERQRVLLGEARRINAPRILISLDADEILTANVLYSVEWSKLHQALPGTVFKFQLINIRPNLKEYWSPDTSFPWGFVDDGADHLGLPIHSYRLPISQATRQVCLREVKVLHYQYTDWDRMKSKHRWYQCWEHVMYPKKSPVDLYRQYHHMDAVKSKDLKDLPELWYKGYARLGIDMKNILKEKQYWWDREVLELFQKYGREKFAQESIWDVDWSQIAERHSMKGVLETADPRTVFEKSFHKYLSLTQPYAQTTMVAYVDKAFRRLLR